IAEGRRPLEHRLDFRPPLRLRISRGYIGLGMGGYVGTIVLVTLLLLALAWWALTASGLTTGWRALLALAGLVPATDVATALVNRAVSRFIGAVSLPALELTAGIPSSLR